MKPIENLTSETSIEELGLRPRTAGGLIRKGYKRLQDISDRTEYDVLQINGIGRVELNNIRAVLAKAGLAFRKPLRSSGHEAMRERHKP